MLICPFMSNSDKKVNCLEIKADCALWYDDGDSKGCSIAKVRSLMAPIHACVQHISHVVDEIEEKIG